MLAPDNLPYQMFLLVQQMTKRHQNLLDPHNLTPLHWGILCCLWVEDGLRTSEIALRLEQLGGTITVGLDSMEARGLVKRKQDTQDRRVSHVLLTKRGRELESALAPAAKALIGELFEVLTPNEYAKLFEQITLLRRHLAAH